MAHGTKMTQEESRHWATRKDIKPCTSGVGIVGHVPPSTSVLGGSCGAVLEGHMGILWHWGRGERVCRACFRGSGSKVVRGNPQLQKAMLLPPSHAQWRGCCPSPGTLWMNSVQWPRECWGTSHWQSFPGQMLQFSSWDWLCSDNLKSSSCQLWQDLLTVMLLTLTCPRNFWLCIQPHLRSCLHGHNCSKAA